MTNYSLLTLVHAMLSAVTWPLWLRTGWTIFFALVSIGIAVFFVIPVAFGLQNFSQWGGMYDDRWCHANFFSGDPLSEGVQKETVNAGEYKTRRVYSAPTHNERTCLAWTRSQCGTVSRAGWTIVWATPYLQGQHFTGGRNVCALLLPEGASWFTPYD